MKSFRTARIAFSKNLNDILNKLNYTPASLSMKLNTSAFSNGSTKSVLSATEVSDWASGKKIPSLYSFYKLCDYLRVSMDELLDPNFSIETVVARSFAAQSVNSPKVVVPTPVSATPVTTATVTTTVATAKKTTSSLNKKHQYVSEHTTSNNFNVAFAYAVLTCGKTLAEVSTQVGASTRSMRDYMYYGMSVPEHVGKKLLKTIRASNYASLGLKYDAATTRYVHV